MQIGGREKDEEQCPEKAVYENWASRKQDIPPASAASRFPILPALKEVSARSALSIRGEVVEPMGNGR